jgi:drug/metabolite transporter (DMT)-like permease
MSSRAAALYLVVAAALWSTSGVLLKSLPGTHWLAIAGVRSLFASLLFLPGLGQPRPPLGKLIAAVLLYAIVVTTLMGSMQLGTAAQGIWLQYIAPVVVALWAVVVYRQRLRSTETIAVLLTALAVFFIVTGGRGESHQRSLLLGLISGIAYGLFLVLLKSLTGSPPAAIFLWTNLGTAALVLPVVLLLGIPLPAAPRELAVLALMGLFQLALAYYFVQWGLAGATAVEASLMLLLEPILNPIWVYLVVGETPSAKVILGCGLIAVGLIVFAFGPSLGGPGRGEGARGRRGQGLSKVSTRPSA